MQGVDGRHKAGHDDEARPHEADIDDQAQV
jgi:hypothetical protein